MTRQKNAPLALVAVLFSGMVLLPSWSVAGDSKQFDAKEVRALFVGHSFEWWSSRGRGTSQYLEDGTSKFTVNGRTADGRWRISGDRFCTYWGAFSNGQEKCHLIYRVDDEVFQKRDVSGSVMSSFKRTDEPYRPPKE